MADTRPLIHTFTPGEISVDALARIDQQKVGQAAQIQDNILPFVVGKGMMRPGTTYLGGSNGNAQPLELPFLKSVVPVSLAGLELTNATLRVWSADALVSRPSVTTTIANGNFTSGSNWTVTATGGANATFNVPGMQLDIPSRGGTIVVDQQVNVPGPSQGVQHGLRITMGWGPMLFQVGSTQGASDLVAVTSLDTGVHSITVTPGSSFWIRFWTQADISSTVTSIAVEAAGVMTLPAPWATADMQAIQFTQSADEVFLAHPNWQPRIIQHRSNNSWSVVLFKWMDGPFALPQASDSSISLTPGQAYGNTTLTASAPIFAATDVGSVWSVNSNGYDRTFSLAGLGAFTEPIRVFGIEPAQQFTLTIAGTFVGTITMENSLTGPSSGFAETTGTYTAPTGPVVLDPGSVTNNVVIWYRFRFTAYTSGTATVRLQNGAVTGFLPGSPNNNTGQVVSASGFGIYRVTSFVSSTQVNVEVLQYPTSLASSTSWSRPQWSGTNGWPTAIRFHQGRLWFAGGSFLASSVSDDYTSFATEEPDIAGVLSVTDDASIQEFIATDGAVYNVNWMVSLGRLAIGTDGAEVNEYADAFDSIVTPTTAQLKNSTMIGSTNVPPIVLDKEAFYINRCGNRVFRLTYNPNQSGYDADDLMELNQYIGSNGIGGGATINQIAVSRNPEPWTFFVRSDGTVLLFIYSSKHQIAGWHRITSPGSSGTDQIISVACYPGTTSDGQDRVYFWCKRTINNAVVYTREKMCLISEAIGAATTKLADCGSFFAGPASTVNAPQLAGCQVVAWGNGQQLGTFTADGSGNVNLGVSATNVWVGLAYTGQYQSAKLAYGSPDGNALLRMKTISEIGLLTSNILTSGVQYGQDFTTMYTIAPPGYGTTGQPYVEPAVDELAYPFDGTWTTDARVCVQISPNTPCTLNALVVDLGTN